MTKKYIKKKERDLIDKYKFRLEDGFKEATTKNCSIPPEHRKFKIGDRVILGNLDYVYVYMHTEDHRAYKIIIINEEFAYGQSKGWNFDIRWTSWTEIFPWVDPETYNDDDKLTEDEDIRFSFCNMYMGSIIHRYYKPGIDLNPEYQRDLVWTQEQKYDLIDSIYRNVEIGKMVMIRRHWETDKDLYEMLDGKQRMNAIIEFYEDRFKYMGKYYSEMTPFDRNTLRNTPIAIADTEPLTDEQKYRYFLKLNTTGTPVDRKHLAKVVELWENEYNKEK